MNWLELNWEKLIGPILQFIAILAAAGTVVWQMSKQHQNSLTLRRENAREALKLQIYETLVQRIRALSDACIEAKMYAFGIPYAIESFPREQSAGYDPSLLKQRVPTFSELHFKAQRQLAELLVDLEYWSIALPGLNVFRIALNAANYDAIQAFPPLFSALLPILPMDPPNSVTGKTMSPETFSALKRLIEEYKDAVDEIECYVCDLTIEAQNNLLHGLFKEMVPPRQPLDPPHKVISTVPEKSQSLIRYFETETPWGKNQTVINAGVTATVLAKASSK